MKRLEKPDSSSDKALSIPKQMTTSNFSDSATINLKKNLTRNPLEKANVSQKDKESMQTNSSKTLGQLKIKANNNNNIMLEYYNKYIHNSENNQQAHLTRMCHEKEIYDRQDQKNINIFEIDPEKSYHDEKTNRYVIKIKPEYAVKAYTRSAADVKMDNPEFLRPPAVLFQTVKYLIDNIVDIDRQSQSDYYPYQRGYERNKYFQYENENYTFKDICLFAEDRFRAIRQDFIILNQKASIECIQSHEIIARFLILSLNECLDYKAFSGSQSLFLLLIQQLNATLTSLREFYSYVEKKFAETSNKEFVHLLTTNKAEFIAYSILLSINQKLDLVSMMGLITQDIRDSPLIKHTIKIVRAILSGEFLTFFKILKIQQKFKSKNFDYLITCLMSLYLKEIRKAAFDVISCKVAKKVTNYTKSIKYISDALAFENFKEFFDYLNWYGIRIPQEIREYLKILKGEEKEDYKPKLNKINSDAVSLASEKDNSEAENMAEIIDDAYSSNSNNLGKNLNENKLDDKALNELTKIFENYDDTNAFKILEVALERFTVLEYFAEIPNKGEADLFKVTNKRFIEAKKHNCLRKEILLEKYIPYI